MHNINLTSTTLNSHTLYNYTHLDFDGFQYSYDFYTYDRPNDEYKLGGGQSARWRLEEQTDAISNYVVNFY